MYDLNGTLYTKEDNIRLYLEALVEFKQEHPDFVGSKVIFAIRKLSVEQIAQYFETARRLKEKFPDFVAGFDMVGQEDKAPMLVQYAEHILQLPSEMKLYFHAGETNWFGGVDENMVNIQLSDPLDKMVVYYYLLFTIIL